MALWVSRPFSVVLGVLFFSCVASADPSCSRHLLPGQFKFAQDLHQRHAGFHLSAEVEREYRRKKTLGNSVSQKPVDKIDSYLDLLKKIHDRGQSSKTVRNRIREFYYRKYIIREENVPDSYFLNQQRIARERGQGTIDITPEIRSSMTQALIKEQKDSLDQWFDYLISAETARYPFYIKYWAFNSMVKLSKFNPEEGTFGKRTAGTVTPFPELNAEAFAFVMDQFMKKMNGLEEIRDEANGEQKTILATTDFGKRYGYELKKIHDSIKDSEQKSTTVQGEWVKFPQGSDHRRLVKSLKGKNTGWCTAGAETAKIQLSRGDFYVFYSLNAQGKPTEPRVAIRMEGGAIGEIRGIEKDQNLDSEIVRSNVVSEKLKEFGDEGELYLKKTADMKRVTALEDQVNRNEELAADDLRFLYEIDSKIVGFGHGRDPRVDEIISKRNKRADIARIFGVLESEVSFTRKEATKKGIKVHIGDLDLGSVTSARGLNLPEIVVGSLYLSSLRSAEGLKLPSEIRGGLSLFNLKSADHLKLPEKIDDFIDLRGLTSAPGLVFPETLVGDLQMWNLTTAEGITFPKILRGDLDLSSLTSIKGLKLPEVVGGSLSLGSLTSAEGLELPKIVELDVNLFGLISARGIQFPEKIGRDLDLRNVNTPKGVLLDHCSIEGDLNVSGLSSVQDVKWPASVRWIYFGDLKASERAKIPSHLIENVLFQ